MSTLLLNSKYLFMKQSVISYLLACASAFTGVTLFSSEYKPVGYGFILLGAIFIIVALYRLIRALVSKKN